MISIDVYYVKIERQEKENNPNIRKQNNDIKFRLLVIDFVITHNDCVGATEPWLVPMYKQLNAETLFVPQDKNNHRSADHRDDNLYRLLKSITLALFVLFYVRVFDVYITCCEVVITAVVSSLALRVLEQWSTAIVLKLLPPIRIMERRYFNQCILFIALLK